MQYYYLYFPLVNHSSSLVRTPVFFAEFKQFLNEINHDSVLKGLYICKMNEENLLK